MFCNKRHTPALCFLAQFAIFLIAFALGKVVFMLTCAGDTEFGLSDIFAVWWHGLPMDLSMTSYLMLLPWLCILVNAVAFAFRPDLDISHQLQRWILRPYFVVASLMVVLAVVADMSLYPYWQFKLDATIFNYIDSPRAAMASVSVGYIILRVLLTALLTAALTWCLWLTVKPRQQSVLHRWRFLPSASTLLGGGVMFLMIRGGVTQATMNVGNAYFSDVQFLNHSAVNPLFSFFSSTLDNEQLDQFYRVMPDAEADELLAGRYPFCSDETTKSKQMTVELTDSLLNTSRPNILLIIWEGCGGQLTEAIGGNPNIVPRLNQLIRDGVFFSEFRANSFRTDRGTLSILSGYISYPLHSLMKMAVRCEKLPSIARSLRREGYSTNFVYGGDVNFTNMKGYLLSTGYEKITADVDFTMEARHSSNWGVADSYLFDFALDDLDALEGSGKPWLYTMLTLSSHEPWDVPFGNSEALKTENDKKLNSFSYTDDCLGRFIDQLRKKDIWHNLLVIILPDHGLISDGIEGFYDPDFFHVPMLWTGGAVAKSTNIPVLMNQSDLAATLLAQMGISHADFPWSRNVLASTYSNPFTYSTCNDAFILTDSTGTTVYDNKAGRASENTTPDSGLHRQRLGLAILQRSYDLLEKLPASE